MSSPVSSFPTVTPVTLRRRGVGNLLAMGHCAPSVMRTMLDASGADEVWPVLLVAGLPGGIGNTGGECGGLTAPLVLLGLRHPRSETRDGLPVVVDRGHDLLRRFLDAQGTVHCRDILGGARVPLRCIGVVSRAAPMCADSLGPGDHHAIPPATRAAYQALYTHWTDEGFHCADEVLSHLVPPAAAPPEALRDAVTAFLGGTLFAGMTCSALAAGVMALGLALGTVERSRPRVLRMIATMAVGGDAFADERNAFNPIMNRGHELAAWFAEQFGSTQCRVLTGCDLGTAEGVATYIAGDQVVTCRAMARQVADRVEDLIARAQEG